MGNKASLYLNLIIDEIRFNLNQIKKEKLTIQLTATRTMTAVTNPSPVGTEWFAIAHWQIKVVVEIPQKENLITREHKHKK